MKLTLLLMLLVAITVKQTYGTNYWRCALKVVSMLPGKRDASQFDKNLDVFTARAARQVLEMADQDGNSQVTVEEFQQFMNELNKLE